MSYLASLVPRDNFVTSETVGSVVRRLQRPSLHPALDFEIPVEAIVNWLAGEEEGEGEEVDTKETSSGVVDVQQRRHHLESTAMSDLLSAVKTTTSMTAHTRKVRGSVAAAPVAATSSSSSPRFVDNTNVSALRFATFKASWENKHGAPARKEALLTGGGGEERVFACLHLTAGPPVVKK